MATPMHRIFWGFALLTALVPAPMARPQRSVDNHPERRAKPGDGGRLKALLQKVNPGTWTFNGFQEVDAATADKTPWTPFVKATRGYTASFIDRTRDVPNLGKGGGSNGVHHPQFSLWIFPRSAENTPEAFEQSIQRYQFAQTQIPSVLGSSKQYVLVGIGEMDDGVDLVGRVANALRVPLQRQR